VKRELLALAIGAAAGAGALVYLRPLPPRIPPEIRTDTLWMEAQRPELEHRGLRDRLTTHRVEGTTAIADAPSLPGRLDVASYCAPAIAETSSGQPAADSGQVVVTLPDFGGRRAGPRLELFSTLGDGRRWSWQGTVRGRIQWQSSGDSVLVTGDRLWVRVARGAPKCGLWGAGGAAAGGLASRSLEGAIAAGAVAALSCAF
jgi:hypothetical protein